MTMGFLQGQEIGKFYGREEILREVTCTFEKGRFYVIKGKSGVGKTTLLNILGTLEKPTAGSVVLEGTEITRLSERERTLLRRDRMGFVFQQYLLIPKLTAVENVALPMFAAQKTYSCCFKRAEELLEQVGLGEKKRSFPYDLSGGEQQRVALARSFANQPQIIFADEPTGNLDAENEKSVIQLLHNLSKEKNCCVIMVSHMEAADAWADEIWHLGESGLTRQERSVTK